MYSSQNSRVKMILVEFKSYPDPYLDMDPEPEHCIKYLLLIDEGNWTREDSCILQEYFTL